MGLLSLFKIKNIPKNINDEKEKDMTTTTKFSFTTREEYKTYKEDWKIRYSNQILEIRAAKAAFKQACREFSLASSENVNWPLMSTMHKKKYELKQSKSQATSLLAERISSKIEAGKQRELRLKKIT